MVFRWELTYDQSVDILDKKYIDRSSVGDSLPPMIYEDIDINSMLKSLLPNELQTKNTYDDSRLKSNSATNKILNSTKKSFSYTIIGFIHSNLLHQFSKKFLELPKVRNLLTLPELTKLIQNETELTNPLLTVHANLFCIVLVLINHPATK